MGGFHGAEVCEIVGLYLLSQLTEIIPKSQIGLYRDDGLAASSARPRQVEILKKENMSSLCQKWAKGYNRSKFESGKFLGCYF